MSTVVNEVMKNFRQFDAEKIPTVIMYCSNGLMTDRGYPVTFGVDIKRQLSVVVLNRRSSIMNGLDFIEERDVHSWGSSEWVEFAGFVSSTCSVKVHITVTSLKGEECTLLSLVWDDHRQMRVFCNPFSLIPLYDACIWDFNILKIMRCIS